MIRRMSEKEVFAQRRKDFCGEEFYNRHLQGYEEACRWMNEFQQQKRPPMGEEVAEFEVAKHTMKDERRFLFGG